MKRFTAVVCLLSAALGVCLAAGAPPPVAEYRNQQYPSGDGPAETVGAPPPVPEYQNHQQARQGTTQQTTEEERPVPAMLRPDGGQWALPLAYSAQLQQSGQPDPHLLDNVVYHLTGDHDGVVALRDESLQVCLIDRFKVPFIVPRQQRVFYTHSLPGMLLDVSGRDRAVFRHMVGDVIYDLCHHLRIYWLDSALYARFLEAAEQQERKADTPVPLVQEDTPRPVTPPPVSLYHALQQQTGVLRGGPSYSRQAPPPLSLYRSLRQQGKAQSNPAPLILLTPPPVAEYRREHPQL